jgi:hypothetical protein
MKLLPHPIIEECRAIYELQDPMERFSTYIDLMTKKHGELLPLGDFSPMGKRQKDFLKKLVEIKAENIVRDACALVSQEIPSDSVFRVMLVAVDEPKNGWTQRYLTDADSRFSDKVATLPRKYLVGKFDRWVTVNLWTVDDLVNPIEITEAIVTRLTRAAIFRAYHQKIKGFPLTLAETLRQEGAALNFAGEKISLPDLDVEISKSIIKQYLNTEDFTIIFAAMYGDAAAESVGYTPLGLKSMAGFAVAQAEAIG